MVTAGRGGKPRKAETGQQPADRLLLRVSDRERTGNGEREPRNRTAGDADRDRPGLAVLAVCKVYAPMYPQLTLAAINTPGVVRPKPRSIAYLGVLSALATEYIAKYNKGHGVVLIGHSQGSLEARSADQGTDRPELDAAQQARLGGAAGRQRARARRPVVARQLPERPAVPAASRHGLRDRVLERSSKNRPNPSNFGRPESALGAGIRGIEHPEVACVNPTLLVRTAAPVRCCRTRRRRPSRASLGNFVPTPTRSTPWISTRRAADGSVQARKRRDLAAGQPVGTEGDTREIPQETLGPLWGLHLYDVNIALGNLVKTVSLQSQAYGFGG